MHRSKSRREAAYLEAEEFAGGKAGGKLLGSVSFQSSDGAPAGLKLEGKGDVFAGVEAKGKVMGKFFRTEFLEHALQAYLEGIVRAGAGASASAKIEFTTEKLELKADGAGAIGVGGGAGFDVSINPLALVACGNAALASALGRFDRELSNVFDERAIQQQNRVLFSEVKNKLNASLGRYEGEVDTVLNGNIRFREELRSFAAEAGLDKLGRFDQNALQSQLQALSEEELAQQKSDMEKNPKLDRREHVFSAMDRDKLDSLAKQP